MHTGFLHDPSLDEFAFLAGITTVDNLVGRCHERLNNFKLATYAFVIYNLYAEFGREHR